MKKCAFESDRVSATGETWCRALYVKECGGCVFRKTEEEAAAGRLNAALRIASLAPDLKNRIADRYYLTKPVRYRNEAI